MDNDILKSIDSKLTLLIRLQAIESVKGRPLHEQIEILHSAGMSSIEISNALGKTPNNIRVQLHLVRKSKIKEKETRKEEDVQND